MNTELLKSKLLEAAFNGSLTHADTSTWEWLKGYDFFLPMESTSPKGKTFKYIDIDAIDNKNCRIREVKIIPTSQRPSRASRKTEKGDVLFSMVRPYLRNIAMVTETDCIASTGFFVCRPSKLLDSKYCYYLMTSDMVVNELNFLMTGDNSPSIRKDDILNHVYPLPPLAEQLRIVAALEEGFAYIDAVASAKQNLSISANLLRSKILEDAFKGLLTSADVNKWEIAELGTACKHQNGDRGKNYPSKKKLSHCGIPFISALNLVNNTVIDDDKLLKMSEEQFNKLGNGKLQQGDFVLCIRGSVGKHGIYPFEKGAIASSLVILRPVPDKLSLMWLSYYFDSSLFRENLLEYINGTAQPNLAAKELMKFRIPLPPLAEQQRIVAKIEELFEQIDKITK